MDKETKKMTGKKLRKVRKVDKDDATVKNNKNGKKKNHKKGWKIFRICLFVFIALFIVGSGVVLGVITGIIDKTEDIDLEKLRMLKETSFVYDRNGNEIGSFSDGENRIIVKYNDIPQSLVDAVVSIEDERFFEHKGIDLKRTLGAIGTYILNGGNSSFGGSTITQQLVKNATNDKETSWTRKIREWYRALSLENKMSKEEIFESYVNTIYLGDGAYGMQAASQNFLGKPLSDITIAEAAVLAAQIQSPEATNPYKSEEAKQKLLDRQKLVLQKMLELGKISQEEYDEAVNQEIEFKRADNSATGEVQSYFVDAVYKQLKKDLIEEQGLSEAMAETKIFGGGLKVYTTMDPDVQNAIDSAYNNSSLFYTDKNGKFMQSAMVVMDQKNGDVVGLIGGAGEKEGALSFNRATDEPKQPGSCMKPIGAYGPAFEQGVLSPGSGIDDAQLSIPNGPGNYYNGFYGYVTVRNAIAKSMNLPAVRAYQKLDVDYVINFARNCGLNHIVSADENRSRNDESYASLALGGLTEGATVLEMANAYATIANGGVHVEPRLYTKVLDSDGNEVLSNESSTAKRVMKESTAYMLTSCLEEVTKTGTAAGYVKVGNIAVAGKTGNTNNDIDQWFCGFTPYYTIACWNGYDDRQTPIGRRSFGSYPYTSVKLFNTVMNAICQGKEAKQFEMPDTVTTALLCKVSGLVATDACRADPRGDQTGVDLVAKDSIPTATCNIHKMVKICNETGKIANEYCPSTSEKSFITRDYEPQIKPSDWQYMLPKETCTVHNSSNRGQSNNNEDNEDDIVDIYKNNINNKR